MPVGHQGAIFIRFGAKRDGEPGADARSQRRVKNVEFGNCIGIRIPGGDAVMLAGKTGYRIDDDPDARDAAQPPP